MGKHTNPIVNGKKRCPQCNQIKNITEFGKDAGNHHGFSCWCKICARKKAWINYLKKEGKPLDLPYHPYNPEHRKIGAKTISDGYVRVHIGKGKWKAEHRIVMEQYLSRALNSHEQVHHINGNKKDNRGKLVYLQSRRAFT